MPRERVDFLGLRSKRCITQSKTSKISFRFTIIVNFIAPTKKYVESNYRQAGCTGRQGKCKMRKAFDGTSRLSAKCTQFLSFIAHDCISLPCRGPSVSHSVSQSVYQSVSQPASYPASQKTESGCSRSMFG